VLTEFPLSYLPRLGGRTAFLALTQHLSPARLAQFQDGRLRRLVRHAAAHVPYYRELFRRIGLKPQDFRGRADLARIPLLDKETVRARADELVADNAARFHPELKLTSGSTGTPLRFMVSAESKIVDAAAALRAYAWAGYVPGMKVFTMKSYMRDWVSCRSMGGRSLDANTDKLTRETGLALWREINRMRPAFFHGYPFFLVMLARIAQEAGIEGHRPRTIISTGESLPVSVRRSLSEAYGGAKIFDYYSMHENAVMVTECRHGTKHIINDYAYHEFVDPAGQLVESGHGEIVGTSYYNYAMPLLRYRTRDFARLPSVPTPCSCGRPFPSVDVIEGRKEDFIVTPDGRILQLIEDPMNEGRGIAASQFIQDASDHLTVNILPSPDFDPECLAAVLKELRRRIGPTMRVDFRLVDELERRPGDSGKIPFLISRIGHTFYAPQDFSGDPKAHERCS
jgi:phenylacetate-CoA ligase